MRAVISLFVFALTVAFGAGSALAAPPTVVINGGGIVENNNSGLGDLVSIGGFTAIAKGDPAAANGSPAKGQIQSKSAESADPTITLAAIHGKVVCVADLQNGDWEVRFRVTRAAGFADGLQDSYGSLFINDEGDMMDEGFADLENEKCVENADVASYALEPVLAGHFTVHQ